jgi:hypothetical protein
MSGDHLGPRQLAQQVQHLAGDVASTARQTAESQLSGSKARAAEGLGSMAQALRQTGEQMRPQDHLGVSPYLSTAAEQIERASDYLQDRSLGQLVGDVESFARREPALFLGGAFLAGLLAGRFLKSSGDTRPTPVRGYLPAYNPAPADRERLRVSTDLPPLKAQSSRPAPTSPPHAPPVPPRPAPASAALPAVPAASATAMPAASPPPPAGKGGNHGGSGSP